ncbi:tissue factor pathway inhibitor 2-like [Rhipicephalus sanguineus]|uniref:tissue factor pathway inhibitor 2-like n=1 Tax=Rhipicephalus sanguineus TaxID=34632 RepID=UPI0018935A0A|nr:tissue factor pathway inhibitor 2-like [Rhipicephalus sanguineus]
MYLLVYLPSLILLTGTRCASSWDDYSEKAYSGEEYSEEVTRRLPPNECIKKPQSDGNSTRTHLMYFYNSTAARCEAYAADLRGDAELPDLAENSFQTKEECNKKCRDPHYGTCGGQKNDSICWKLREVERRFWFDPDNRTCKPYMYGGCDPNSNTYRTKLECLQDCAEFIENRCAVPIDEGDCFDEEVRYGYNPVYQDCERFNYTGCGGNQNNFKVAKDCWLTCANKSRCLKHTEEHSGWYRPYTSYFYDVNESKCKRTKTFFRKSFAHKFNRFGSMAECERNCMRIYKPRRKQFSFLHDTDAISHG